eukprot:5788300-Alexandrium_andersonii.AAC.1
MAYSMGVMTVAELNPGLCPSLPPLWTLSPGFNSATVITPIEYAISKRGFRRHPRLPTRHGELRWCL